MTPYASVALFRRDGALSFRPPRKERSGDMTQARKSAMRYWSGVTTNGDKLTKIALVREISGRVEISERTTAGSWVRTDMEIAQAAKNAHLKACLAELGIDPQSAPPSVPDVLTINGFVYRREI